MAPPRRLISLMKGMVKPSESNMCIDEIKKIIKKYGSIATPVKASIIPATSNNQALPSYKLRVDWSHNDYHNLEKVTFDKEYLLNLGAQGNINQIILPSQIQDVSNELASSSSLDGKLKAVVKEVTKDGKTSRIIEIWGQHGKLKTINGEKTKSYGKIHLNAGYGVLEWSKDGSRLMFIAEKFHTASGYFAEKDNKDDIKAEKPEGQGEEYIYREEWGEQLEGIGHSIVCVIDIEQDFKLRTIEMDGYSLKEGFWIDEKTIGFIGLSEEPRRLGLIFCPIRQSYLFKCDLSDPESKPTMIYGKDENVSIRSPRVSLDGKKLIFLKNLACGPHYQASDLISIDLETLQTKDLISSTGVANKIDEPRTINSLYALSLPKNCWTTDCKQIIIVSDMGYRSHLFLVDAENGSSERLKTPGKDISVLAFRDDIIVINSVEPNLGPNLLAGRINSAQKEINLVPVDPMMCQNLDDMVYKFDILEEIYPTTGTKHLISTILLSPKELLDKPSPTVVIPHGGPHSSFSANFIPSYLALVEIGFKLILVNYRGSTGLSSGQERYLCGKVGTADVADVMRCLEYHIDHKQVDPGNVFLYGGSHGGFLVTHLIGQHSDFGFRACVAINPVTDLAAGLVTSDIPDWHLVEGLGRLEPYPFTTIPSAEFSAQMLEKSPIIHVDKVRTPLLMLLGSKDKRVAMCQGLNFYYAVKARGIEAKCLIYEDNHSLGKLPHAVDVDVNRILWFLDHMSQE